jgi:hypothetical protein
MQFRSASTQEIPAFALKEVDSREAEDERQQKKNGVHTGAFLQNPHVERRRDFVAGRASIFWL